MPDRATIRKAYSAERAKRRPYWIGGVPTADDLTALCKHVARTLKITPEAVLAAIQKEQADV